MGNMKVFFAIAWLVAVSAEVSFADIYAFDQGFGHFGRNFYEEALKSHSGNMLISPASADIIMMLANAGAKGKTSEQIASAFYLPNDVNTHEILKELLPLIKGNDEFKLSTANKIYVKEGFSINIDYKTVATTVFGSEIENINFNDATKAANDINAWVEEQTENKIKDIIKSDDISQDTRMVLINALYFHADWATEFFKENTFTWPFYLNADNQVDVDTMKVTSMFKYYKCNIHNLKVLQMPYKGDDVVMTIILPDEKEGLSNVENQLEAINTMTVDFEEVLVEVKLPKFKIESTIEMEDILKNLGVIDAFDSALADFSGMSADDSEKLHIDKVVQKTFINVDEEGTEAAASTGVMIVAESIRWEPTPQETFHADHPFMFVITHKKTNMDLFFGRIVNPEMD